VEPAAADSAVVSIDGHAVIPRTDTVTLVGAPAAEAVTDSAPTPCAPELPSADAESTTADAAEAAADSNPVDGNTRTLLLRNLRALTQKPQQPADSKALE